MEDIAPLQIASEPTIKELPSRKPTSMRRKREVTDEIIKPIVLETDECIPFEFLLPPEKEKKEASVNGEKEKDSLPQNESVKAVQPKTKVPPAGAKKKPVVGKQQEADDSKNKPRTEKQGDKKVDVQVKGKVALDKKEASKKLPDDAEDGKSKTPDFKTGEPVPIIVPMAPVEITVPIEESKPRDFPSNETKPLSIKPTQLPDSDKSANASPKLERKLKPVEITLKRGQAKLDTGPKDWRQNLKKTPQKVSVKERMAKFTPVAVKIPLSSSEESIGPRTQKEDSKKVVEKMPSVAVELKMDTKSQPEEQVSPKFVQNLVDKRIYEGESVKLEAKFIGTPKPSFIWLKEEQPFSGNQRIRIYEEGDNVGIEITTAELDDEADYMCIARNDVGEAKTVAELLVEEAEDKA